MKTSQTWLNFIFVFFYSDFSGLCNDDVSSIGSGLINSGRASIKKEESYKSMEYAQDVYIV